MIEIVVGLALCIFMAKVASFEGRSSVIWFCVTFALCFASLATVPIPYVRFLIAGGIAFGAMFVLKLVGKD